MHCSGCGRELAVEGMFPGATVRCVCGLSQSVVVGGEKAVPAVAAPARAASVGDHGCPRCHAALDVRDAHGLVVAACPDQHGLFVTHVVLRAVKDAPGVARALGGAAAAAGPAMHDDDASLACPTCGEAMGQQSMGAAQVKVDVCATHGTWFDAGELAASLARDAKPAADPNARANASLDVALALEAARDENTLRAGIETADDLLDTFNLFVLGRPSLRRRY